VAATTSEPCISDGPLAQGFVKAPAKSGTGEEPVSSTFQLLARREMGHLSSSSSLGERLKPTMASTTCSTCISDSPLAQGPVKEQLDELSFQIYQYAKTLRSIIGVGVLGKADVASEEGDADWGADSHNQVKFNPFTIPKYELTPKERIHYGFK